MSIFSRRRFLAASAAAGIAVSQPARLWARNANERVAIGFISCGGRALRLMDQFLKTDLCDIVAVCDPDPARVAAAKEIAPDANTFSDLRKLIEDPTIDAVVIATGNHWHCLAAIWAMEAGKHVYVEKPLSHTQWEGVQTVAAAERYGKICQVGTQQRSDPMQADIKKFLHQEKALGEIKSVKVNRYGVRGSIGKRDKPLEIPAGIDYDLWLGPAQNQPIMREKLHYDWHWDWNTGSGEMGNWGVHLLDDVRNNIFQDKVKLPKKIFGGGGRIAWNDAGQTPNVHFTYIDTGDIPVVIGLSNVSGKPGSKESAKHTGPTTGYIAHCEGGTYFGQRGEGVAMDKDGKVIRKFKGNSGNVLHMSNFCSAVIADDPTMLNAGVEVGNDSTGWCNLANVSFRAGSQMSVDQAREVDHPQWQQLIDDMEAHLDVYGKKISEKEFKMSPMMELSEDGSKFVGDGAQAANVFLKREYRKGFEVPELATVATAQ
jgi:predicted dehydrogenase